MIAPAKKFGRVGLCTNFISNKHGGGEEGELAELAFNLFGVRAHYFRYSKFKHSREGFDRFFLPFFKSDFVALSAFSGTDFTSFEAFSDTFHSGQIRSPLSLRIVAGDFVLVSFTYTVDFSSFIGTTQEKSTINCGAFVDPNYFLFCPSYVATLQSTRDFFMYSSLESLSGEKLRGDVYNTLLFGFAK